jgi:hypothetical protein
MCQVPLSLELVGGKLPTSPRLHKEIADFILDNNTEGRFNSALRHNDSFRSHIKRLVDEGQMMVFYKHGKIVGCCGWALVHDRNSIDKLTWKLPDNITDGRILYVSVAVLTGGAKILWIKDLLEKRGYRDKVDSIFWVNSVRRRMFKKGVKSMDNCGLSALAKMRGIRDISAFTLIHAAQDNGMDLNIFKVDPKRLALVPRPAIFHAEGHFEYIKNGEPLPNHPWTGYVLVETKKLIGRPITHKEAKEVRGAGLAPVVSAVIAAVRVVQTAITIATLPVKAALAAAATPQGQAAIGGALKGALTGALTGGVSSKLQGGSFRKGAAQGAKFGAITGGVTGGAAGFAGSSNDLLNTVGTFAKEHPKITSAGVGATQGAIQGGAQGALSGAAQGAAIGAGVEGIGNFQQGFGSLGADASLRDRLVAGFDKTVGISRAVPPEGAPRIPTPGGISNVTVPGVGSNVPLQSSEFNPSTGFGRIGTSRSGFDLGNIESFNPQLRSQLAANFSGGGGGGSSPLGADRKDLAGTVAGFIGKQLGPQASTKLDFDPEKDFDRIRQTLGDQALPQATEAELLKFVNTPLEDLTNEFSFQSDKVFRRINESFDRRIAGIDRRGADFGQSRRTSSDLRNEVAKAERERTVALAEAQQEINNANTTRAIQAKQFAFTEGLKKGRFDSEVAFDLANVIGRKAQLEAALEQENVNDFQEIMSEILQIGFA